mmetsp:Transcript_28699/g.60597  ORF Transcript_28699/g.60597 Transcript_28699/m.60597 type:complete len:126 (+) Transcript_28699:178-555(+)
MREQFTITPLLGIQSLPSIPPSNHISTSFLFLPSLAVVFAVAVRVAIVVVARIVTLRGGEGALSLKREAGYGRGVDETDPIFGPLATLLFVIPGVVSDSSFSGTFSNIASKFCLSFFVFGSRGGG